MWGDTCDLPEFCEVKEIKKSKKPHRCCECGDTIPTGSSYVYISGKWDGEVSSFHQHQECAEACRSVRDDISEGCIAFGHYTEWLGECFCWRPAWSSRMRAALVDLVKKHPRIKDQVRCYVVEDDNWYLQKKSRTHKGDHHVTKAQPTQTCSNQVT